MSDDQDISSIYSLLLPPYKAEVDVAHEASSAEVSVTKHLRMSQSMDGKLNDGHSSLGRPFGSVRQNHRLLFRKTKCMDRKERCSLKKWSNDELEQFLNEAGNLEKYSCEDESDVSTGSFVIESATDINEMKQYQERSVNADGNTDEDLAFFREETIQSTYSKQQQNDEDLRRRFGHRNSAAFSELGLRNQSFTLPRASATVIRRSSLPVESIQNSSPRQSIPGARVVGSQEIYPDPKRATSQKRAVEDESNHESWTFQQKVNYFMKRIQEQSPPPNKMSFEKSCCSQTP